MIEGEWYPWLVYNGGASKPGQKPLQKRAENQPQTETGDAIPE